MRKAPPGPREIAFLQAIQDMREPIKPGDLSSIDPTPVARQRCRDLGLLRFIPARHGDSGWRFTQNGRKFLAACKREAGAQEGSVSHHQSAPSFQ